MRKAILLIAILSLVSCEDHFSTLNDSSFEVQVSADMHESTKTALSGTSLSWKQGDNIGIFASGYQTNKLFAYSTVGQIFTGVFDKTGQYSEQTDYYAYYPYSSSVTGSVVSASLSSIQNAPFDGKCDFMVSDTLRRKYSETDPPELKFTFSNHLFAIVKITITNSDPSYADESLKRVTLFCQDTILAGQFTFDANKGRDAEATFINGGQRYVSVVFPDASRPKLGLNVKHEVYAVVRPVENKKIKLIVDLSSKEGFLETASTVSFSRGCVTSLPVVNFSTCNGIHQITDYKYNCVFMGDSITQFWPAENQGGHPSFFSMNNYLSKGISGQKTWEMVSRFNSDVVKNNPRAVIILAGTNNIGHYPTTCDVNVIKEDIATMCEMAESAGIIPIICSITPRSTYNNMVIDANVLLKKYAEDNDVTYVDYYSDMSIDDVYIKSYFRDGLHPSSKGYYVMESICQPVIEDLLFN